VPSGLLAVARLSTGRERFPVDKNCGLPAGNSESGFSSTQPVDHIFPVQRPLPVASSVVSTGLSPGCAQPGRRVCTRYPHRRPPGGLVPAADGQQNVRAIG
jgi:hypothetical protein